MTEMKHIKRSLAKKKKLMLWVDLEDIEYLETIEPRTITVQSKIRQILQNFRETDGDIGAL